jgi:hypothetical protein
MPSGDPGWSVHTCHCRPACTPPHRLSLHPWPAEGAAGSTWIINKHERGREAWHSQGLGWLCREGCPVSCLEYGADSQQRLTESCLCNALQVIACQVQVMSGGSQHTCSIMHTIRPTRQVARPQHLDSHQLRAAPPAAAAAAPAPAAAAAAARLPVGSSGRAATPAAAALFTPAAAASAVAAAPGAAAALAASAALAAAAAAPAPHVATPAGLPDSGTPGTSPLHCAMLI